MKTKTDFSKVGPGIDGTAAPAGKTGPRRWLWPVAGLVALAVVILVVAVACGGSGDDKGSETEAIKTAHGPSALVDGVPRGYTHDKVGAQTAAVNFAQAVNEAAAGRLDAEALRKHAAAASTSPALDSIISDGVGREETDTSTFNLVPLIVNVTDFSPNKAVVSIWGQGIGQSHLGGADGEMAIVTSYSTADVTLVWEDGDWKASDWAFQSGPTPDEAMFPDDGPLSDLGGQGLYVFYRD